MVKRNFLFTIALLVCSLTTFAQQTLSIHTTTQGTVSITFAEKPVVTFPAPEVLKVTSEQLTVEFPFTEVEKISFEDNTDAVKALVERDGISDLRVYDLSGRLVHQASAKEGTATLNLSALHSGVYVVKDGKRTYKIRVK